MWKALSTCPDVNRSQQKAVLAAAFSTLTLWQVRIRMHKLLKHR